MRLLASVLAAGFLGAVLGQAALGADLSTPGVSVPGDPPAATKPTGWSVDDILAFLRQYTSTTGPKPSIPGVSTTGGGFQAAYNQAQAAASNEPKTTPTTPPSTPSTDPGQTVDQGTPVETYQPVHVGPTPGAGSVTVPEPSMPSGGSLPAAQPATRTGPLRSQSYSQRRQLLSQEAAGSPAPGVPPSARSPRQASSNYVPPDPSQVPPVAHPRQAARSYDWTQVPGALGNYQVRGSVNPEAAAAAEAAKTFSPAYTRRMGNGAAMAAEAASASLPASPRQGRAAGSTGSRRSR
jgi:hypothetical protein